MMKTFLLTSAFLLITLFTIAQSAIDVHPEHAEKTSFRPNLGQWEGDFSHVVYLNQYEAYITNQGLIIGMSPAEELNGHHDSFHDNVAPEDAPDIPVFSYSMLYDGANLVAQTEDLNPSEMYRNYFLGPQSQWVSSVRDALSVLKSDVYPGINVHYKVDESSNLEYDYIVAPGADPSLISWSYTGVNPIVKESKIHISTPYGLVEETIPEAYQVINGEKNIVDVRFIEVDGIFSFEVGEYNTNHPLIIDPVIVASTLTGTVGTINYGHGATYDEQGNVFSFGRSFGSGVPTGAGVIQPDFGGGGTDVVLNKFNPTGTDQIYATYLGGSGQDLPHSAITNLAGDCFVFGSTESTNYPIIPGAIQSENGGEVDIFISRVSPDGTELIASTYIGGSAVDGRNLLAFGYDSFRGELSLDQEGNVYVASATGSDDFPSTSGAYATELNGSSDGVVAKLSPSLSSAFWITLVGGSEGDMVYGVRVKDNGQVVFAGSTEGSTYPSTNGAYQESGLGTGINGVAGILNSSGSALLNSTFASTSEEDQAFFLDLDNDENVWIYGRTAGPDEWPITDDVFTTETKNLFITQFDQQLSEVLVSTMVGPETAGGFGNPNPVAFLVDRCDRVYISCYGAPTNLPLTPDALFETGGFYLAAFEEGLTILSFATYYTESHVDGGTSRFDKKGVVYQGVCSGGGFNTNPDAYATDQSIGWDVGVFKIDFELSEGYLLIGPESICEGSSAEFSIESPGDGDFEWSIPDGWTGIIDGSTITVTPDTNAGVITVTPFNECAIGEPQSISVSIGSDSEASFNAQVCEGASYTFPDGETDVDIMDEYSHTSILESMAGCDSIIVTNISLFVVESTSEILTVCQGESATFADGTAEEDIQSDFSHTSVLTSAAGCDSMVVSNVEVSFVESSIEQQMEMLVAAENMDTYAWLLCDDGYTELIGENNMTYTPVVSGSYAVIVTNAFGCADTSLCYQFTVTSVEGINRKSELSVFPNPTNGEITITGIRAIRYELYDTGGQIIENGRLQSQSDNVKLMFTDIPAGLYMLRLFTADGYENVRVVIE